MIGPTREIANAAILVLIVEAARYRPHRQTVGDYSPPRYIYLVVSEVRDGNPTIVYEAPLTNRAVSDAGGTKRAIRQLWAHLGGLHGVEIREYAPRGHRPFSIDLRREARVA